jgi:Zn ribbon nucleic-acid-binding protein
MIKNCSTCSAEFEVTDGDLAFYNKVSPEFGEQKYNFPAPTKCPACRQQQRLAFRNLRSMHHRKCDFTGRQIISCFDSGIPQPVYHSDIWWSDKWEGLDYGRDFDFNKSFFEQFKELYEATPFLHQYTNNCENCEFINGAGHSKDCYMSSDLDYCENAYYVDDAKHCNTSIDCNSITSSELCYDCTDCDKCYNLQYSQRCKDCSDSYFLTDCQNCTNCIGCANLVNKEYHVFNEPVSKEQFEEYKKDIGNRNTVAILKKRAEELSLSLPKKYYFGHSNEDSSGNIIHNLKNSPYCFEAFNLENCKYCRYFYNSNNCMDVDVFGENSQWLYECQATGINCSNNAFCMFCWEGSANNYYCHLINACKDCFGCCSLRNKQYCIFNKQYTKEDYESLVPKIIKHMQSTGEWGEFFPIELCPYGFNETIGHEFTPLTKQEAIEKNLKWYEDTKTHDYMGPDFSIPDTIAEINDDICKEILVCKTTQKPYKIIPQELTFYRNNNIPIPLQCPAQRYQDRFSLRNPRKLWTRECDKCAVSIETSYKPGRPETVYCEACYLAEVF